MALATTRAALIRGTTTEDGLGDEIESNDTPVAGWADFPVSIIRKGERVFDQASATWRTVEMLVARAVGTLPVATGDRLRDNRDGRVYAIDDFERTARGLSGTSSVTLKLRRTTAS